MIGSVEKGFINLSPHSQRPAAWNPENIYKFLGDIVLPIYYGSDHLRAVPDLMLAMCDEYKYDDKMMMLCLIDGGNRLRTLAHFCGVKPFNHGKKKKYDPCLEILLDGKIHYLYFAPTELSKKKEKEMGNVIYLTQEQQEKLLNFTFTAKLPFRTHTFEELNKVFNSYQNSQPISNNSSEYLKNVNFPLGSFCLRKPVYKKIYDLTADLINSEKFYVQITVMFYLLYYANKTRFSEKPFLDIISNDDKNLNKKIRTSEDINVDLIGTDEDFGGFKQTIDRFNTFMRDFCNDNTISMILFKSLYFVILRTNRTERYMEKLLENKVAILSYDKEHNKKVWYGKSNEQKIPYNNDDIRVRFEETIQLLESFPTRQKFVIRDSRAVQISSDDDDEISTITRKTDHNNPQYRRERKLVFRRDFGENASIYCLCCNKRKICITNRVCGHIISQKIGGPDTKENMISICKKCNGNSDIGMGTGNLFEFQERYYPDAPSARKYMEKTNSIVGIEVKNDITNFTVDELKDIARNNRVPIYGTKQVLYDRVKAFIDRE
jgi:5-methylcytosine-specific restriction endonuclease McrA